MRQGVSSKGLNAPCDHLRRILLPSFRSHHRRGHRRDRSCGEKHRRRYSPQKFEEDQARVARRSCAVAVHLERCRLHQTRRRRYEIHVRQRGCADFGQIACQRFALADWECVLGRSHPPSRPLSVWMFLREHERSRDHGFAVARPVDPALGRVRRVIR